MSDHYHRPAMTAADAREELESAIWRIDPASIVAVVAVLAAADRYAEAVADERIAGHVADKIHGPERLAAAAADVAAHHGRGT